jgi:hypothetical protein
MSSHPHYEYRTIRVHNEAEPDEPLTEWGRAGWRVVNVSPGMFKTAYQIGRAHV